MTYHPRFAVNPNSGRTTLIAQLETSPQEKQTQAVRSRDQDWNAIFTEWSQSDLSQSAFCKQRGIKRSAFDYYRNKRHHEQNNAAKKWVPVEIATPPKPDKAPSADYQLSFPTGARLSIPHDYDKSTLTPLLKLLGACS